MFTTRSFGGALRGNGVRFTRLVFIGVLSSAALLAPSGPLASATSDTPTCAGAYVDGAYYNWGGFYTSHYGNNGVYGDINYEKDDMKLDNNQTDHGLLYLDAEDQQGSDPNNYYGYDWVQAGYAVGAIDGIQTPTTEVYVETNGPNDPNGAHAKFFSGDAWGNRLFTVGFNGDISGSYGQYTAYYSDSYDPLGSAWLTDYYHSRQYAQAEGMVSSENDLCPFMNSYFGTDGNESDPHSSAGTVISAYTNSSPGYAPWTPGNIDTSSHYTGPYFADIYSSYDAFSAFGGSA